MYRIMNAIPRCKALIFSDNLKKGKWFRDKMTPEPFTPWDMAVTP